MIVIMCYDHINLFFSKNIEDRKHRRLKYHLFFISTRSLVCESRLEVSLNTMYYHTE